VQAWFTNADGETEFTELNIDAQKKCAHPFAVELAG
jgi:hypothetical protein